MNNTSLSNKRQVSHENVKLVLKPFEQATLEIVKGLENGIEAPDKLDHCGNWQDIAAHMRDAAVNGAAALEAAKLEMFTADPRFQKVYAQYTPVPVEQQAEPEDLYYKVNEKGKKTLRYSDGEDIDATADPEWFIDDILQERTITMLYGDAGIGKTFISLDIALHLALGIDWKGHAVRSAKKVLYIYGEGAGGLKGRLNAWYQHYGYTKADLKGKVMYVTFPVQIRDNAQEVSDTLEEIGEVGLVVIDTYSMCSSGVNENDNAAVAQWMNASHRIKSETGCAVIVVHHIGKSGDYRGASSFSGNVDNMICASEGEDGTTILLESKKQREGANFSDIYLERKTIDLGLNSVTFKPMSSCTVVAVDREAQVREKINGEQLVLMTHIAANPAITGNQLRDFAQSNKIGRTTYDNRKDYMLKNGLIEINPGKNRSQLISLTEKGQNTLAAAAVDGEV